MRRIFLLAAIAVIASACARNRYYSPPPPYSDPQPSQPSGASVSEKDNGGQIIVSPGGMLTISLQANSGTGYQWRITEYDHQVVSQQGDSVFSPPEHPMPGAPGHEIFKFNALSPGSTSIKMELVRAWERPPVPAKTFSVNVTVR